MIIGVGRSTIPARAPHTVTRQVGDEFVVLDRDHARSLAGAHAAVWAAAGTDADVDPTALAELTELGLLDAPGVSRRSMLKRSGVVAAGVAGVGIASIALPPAAAAKSNKNIALTPGTGIVGSTVSVSGSGFTATSSNVSVTFDGATMTTTPASPTTNTSGAFSNVQFTVPAAVAGAHTVAVVVGLESVTATYTVTPSVTLSRTSFVKNTTTTGVTATGTGFAAGAAITITGTNGFVISNKTPAIVTVAPAGGFTASFSVTSPSGNNVSGTIVFSDGTNSFSVPVITTN
jgi:hypothetical protein